VTEGFAEATCPRRALQLHEREHGEFPATLAELVKNGYLKSIPLDPFGKGEPFHFRREDGSRKGGVLWSVCVDGRDEEGKGDRVFKVDAPR
jgi:hypothetical protein